MNAQQSHHQSVPNEAFYSVDSEDLTQQHLSGYAMHEDFDWEDYESEFADESIPGYLLDFIKEAD